MHVRRYRETYPIFDHKSPDVKRYIAGLAEENAAKQQKETPMAQEARLMDTVHTLAANLNRIMEALAKNHDSRGSNEGLAKASGVSSNTVGRARRADGTITVAKLTKIAKALKLQAFQLLAPDCNLSDPPEIVSKPSEKNLLRAFRDRPEEPAPLKH